LISNILQIYGIKEYHEIIKLLRFGVLTIYTRINDLVGIFWDIFILLRLMGLTGPYYCAKKVQLVILLTNLDTIL